VRNRIRYYRDLPRYRDIARILLKYGLGNLTDLLGLRGLVDLPRRLRGSYREPQLTVPERLRLAIEELGPTFIKFGQILSTRPDLIPPAYIKELVKLQDVVPPAPWEAIREQIERELNSPLEKVFASFDPEPIAAASLAQVYKATLHSGEEVVVKVQRPNIEKTIEVDLDILADLALLAKHTPLRDIYDMEEIVEEFAFTLRNELNYIREGHNADRFRKNFAHEPYLYIPKVFWDYTTRRVLVLERISGIKISDVEAIDAAGIDRHTVALNAARIIIKEVLIDGFFHADPHPGNFFVMEGGVIGAMDFGMVGYLTREDRENLIRLYIVAARLDAEGIVDQLIRIGAAGHRVDRVALKRDIARLLTKYYGLPLKDIRAREVMDEVMPITFRHKLRLPSQYWLLGKTLAMMEGVGLQLDPDFDFFAVSERYVHQFMWQMLSPRLWGERAVKGLLEWGEFMVALPRQVPSLLDQAERGELGVVVSVRESEEVSRRLDRIANRLSLSVLLAAFIVALALLITSWPSARWYSWGIWPLLIAFLVAGVLGLWLLISVFLASRR